MKLYKGNTIEVLDEKTETIPKPFSAIIVQSYECRLCKEDVNLIELPNHRYVCEQEVRNKMDLLWLNFCAKQIDAISTMLFHDKRIMENAPYGIANYVDENSLEEISRAPIFKRNK